MQMRSSENELMHEIIQSLKDGKRRVFLDIIDELQPYDVAQQYQHLPAKHRNKFLLYLTLAQLKELMEELSKEDQLEVLQKLGIEKSTKVLDLMENDDLTTLLADLEPEQIEELMSEMKKEESDMVQHMMKYPAESAGRLMNNRFVWISKHYTVREAVDKLKDFAELAEYLNYLYVIDEGKKLVGVVSYKDLLLGEMQDKIEDIMFTRVVKVDVLTDQEDVAKLISRYDFVSIPVIEDNDKLMGVITVDDILDVVIQEANEDIEKLSASGKAIDFKTKPLVAAYRRLPWLILLLLIGLVSGSIIDGFSETLQSAVALAFFMPMIAGMTGNTGTQSLAVVVRGLVAQDLDVKQVVKLIFRELWVGIIIGLTCAILISIIAFIWQGSLILGIVVGSSLLITLIIGTLAGTIIPLVLYKFNIDPAVASGPLITTINDIFSLLVYFGIASMFISKLS
ncbi:magnesium transporter [[Bacillus] enclensis]|uniref:Magnesium transporter MgtE n=1 Tax=[Bacillus] enclensis TaxID=1402860 RepID=A0A0V8HJN7_9BACI|nr:magnesium transporter [[Bacillus] enclensis]KSU62708.1 magnesium transporter [[Bacillus] enclensis]QTC42600.1 magnesium transporter [Bacillus sp. V3]SCC08342.1 magnesium transporter [[Bacillus] enclensis]